MHTYTPLYLKPDEKLAVISALAEVHDLSGCDITNEDIAEFCRATGWGYYDEDITAYTERC
ncbi:MAG: hypothetical protein WCF96_09500 [Eubacteriales bacterium]